MDSKILIDIDNCGRPNIYIDFKPSDDLRDKILGRFIFESGACMRGLDDQLPNPTRIDLHILSVDQQSGRLQAMIELPQPEKEVNEPDVLKELDDMCVESLAPEVYEKWSDVMWTLKRNRQALKRANLPR